jgi:hypothetical protein
VAGKLRRFDRGEHKVRIEKLWILCVPCGGEIKEDLTAENAKVA